MVRSNPVAHTPLSVCLYTDKTGLPECMSPTMFHATVSNAEKNMNEISMLCYLLARGVCVDNSYLRPGYILTV